MNNIMTVSKFTKSCSDKRPIHSTNISISNNSAYLFNFFESFTAQIFSLLLYFLFFSQNITFTVAI